MGNYIQLWQDFRGEPSQIDHAEENRKSAVGAAGVSDTIWRMLVLTSL